MPTTSRQMPPLCRILSRASIACVLACVAGRAGAQNTPAPIVGTVVDSATHIGVAGAEVLIDGTSNGTITDERGEFHLRPTSDARVALRVRRLGFRPRVVTWAGGEQSQPLRVELAAAARPLAPVTVRAERTRYTGRLAGYYERLEQRSIGQFITRADIELESRTQLSQVLRRAPGVTIGRGRAGVINSVRMRGRECWPLVWLDGAQMGAGDIDIDSFSPSSLEGIELYLGSASAPSRYQAARGKSECGTILLWSRATDEVHHGGGVSAKDLEAMVASLSVYTAEQVDTAAVLDTVHSPAVAYPQTLRATGTSGVVIVEFVVDTAGRVEADNIGVMSATNPLFAQAVREALPSAVFRPARRGGRAVRQLVRQPFEFQAPRSGASKQ